MAEHCCTSRFFAVEGYLRLTHSFSVISEKITINHILPKTRFLGLYLLWHKAWFYLQPCDVIDSKDIDFGRITHNNGHYAVPDHSRSPFLVPNESSYATSYVWIIQHRFGPFLRHRGFILIRFSPSTERVPLFIAFVREESLNSGLRNLVSRN